jgi:hypothetical protein
MTRRRLTGLAHLGIEPDIGDELSRRRKRAMPPTVAQKVAAETRFTPITTRPTWGSSTRAICSAGPLASSAT